MDFDVILFESGLYDCKKANELLKQGESIDNTINNAIFEIWSKSLQCQNLFDYIKNNIDQIDIGGVDNQLTGNFSNYLLHDLKNYLQSINVSYSTIPNWNEVETIITNFMDRVYYNTEPPEEAIINNFISALEQLIVHLEDVKNLNNPSDINFWIQEIKNIINYSNFKWGQYGYETGDVMPAAIRRMRDEQMGRNLVWHAKENYPSRKIIVWAATYHNIRNLSRIKSPSNHTVNPNWADMTTMGEVAHDSLGSDVYSIGFTAYKGTYGYKGTYDITTLTTPPDDSMEDLFYRTGMVNLFLDFRTKSQVSGGNWLTEDILSRPLGYVYDLANWTEILDGMVYTRFMIPSEMIN
jgi:erythromycin esterase